MNKIIVCPNQEAGYPPTWEYSRANSENKVYCKITNKFWNPNIVYYGPNTEFEYINCDCLKNELHTGVFEAK